jgi:hypothetical protein
MDSTDDSSIPSKAVADDRPQTHRPGTLSAIESVSRLAAVSIAVIYAAGFLIVTTHCSQFGIVEFSPFRPRIFSAGALFALLLAVPLLAVSRAFRFYGLGSDTAPSIRLKPENVQYLRVSVAAQFYFICFSLCFPSLVLFPPGYFEIKPWGFTLTLLAYVLLAVASVAERERFDSHPLRWTVLSFLCTIGLLVVGFQFWGRSYFWLSVWYFFVATSALYLHDVSDNPAKIKGLAWEKGILYSLTVVLAFATGIYARISPSFGGGSPTPAVLHLATDLPISSSRSVRVLLVDENDFGYYVLKPGQQSTAYFLRRDSVSSIEFERR